MAFFSLEEALTKGIRLKAAAGDAVGSIAAIVTPTGAGSSKELLEAYHRAPWLRAVVDTIATEFAATQWRLFRVTGAPKATRKAKLLPRLPPSDIRTIKASRDQSIRFKLLDGLISAGDAEELTDHEVLQLLMRANPCHTGLTARKLTQKYYDLKGESFWLMERATPASWPVAYWPIPPSWVTDMPDRRVGIAGGGEDGGVYKVNINGSPRRVAASDIFAMIDPNLNNPYMRGKGVGESLGDEIESDEYAANMVKMHFLNRGTPDYIIAAEGANQESLDRAKDSFDKKIRGYWNSGTSFWHRGKLVLTQLQHKFGDMELLGLRGWMRDAFISVYGVPPELVGVIENSNRATIEAAMEIMARKVLIPRLENFRSEVQVQIIDPIDPSLVLDYVSPLPENRQFQLDAMKAFPWSVKESEWRAVQGLTVDPDEDDRRFLQNSILSGESFEEIEENRVVPSTPQSDQEDKSYKQQELPAMLNQAQIEQIVSAIDDDDMRDELVEPHGKHMQDWYEAEWVGVMDAVDKSSAAAITKQVFEGTPFDQTNPLFLAFMAQFAGERVVDIGDTTRDQTRLLISALTNEGAGGREIARELEAQFGDYDKVRALRIARTEFTIGHGASQTAAYQDTGVVDEHRWKAVGDAKTRDTHRALDGQVVDLGANFVSESGATGPHPGAMSTAAENVNCRCTTFAVLPETKATKPEVAKARAGREKSWIRDLEAGSRKAFRKQLKAVLAELDKVTP